MAALLGCASPLSPTPSPTPAVATEQPSASAEPRLTSPSPEVIYREDFASERSWYRFVGDFGSGRVIDGRYRMRVGPDGSWLYSTSTTWPYVDDTAMEATVTLEEGGSAVQATVVCRGVDAFTWYEAGVSSDGVAFIDQVRDSDVTTLATADTEPLTVGQSMRLELTCEGVRPATLGLAIDGRSVAEASVPNGLALGFVGLAVSADGAAIVDFTDIVVRRP